ncbi:MAG: MAPEG family protein [bacterium]
MGNEISILGLYGLVVIVTIFIQATAAAAQVGAMVLLKPRDNLQLTGVAARLDRAQLNSIVALAMFAPAIMILNQMGMETPATLFCAQAFLIARVLYVPLYAFGIAGLRTLAWTVGILATAWLYLIGLGWV